MNKIDVWQIAAIDLKVIEWIEFSSYLFVGMVVSQSSILMSRNSLKISY